MSGAGRGPPRWRRVRRALGDRRRRLAGEAHGAAAVEFAAVGAVIIVLSLAVVEFGRVLYVQIDMSFATEIASRRALVDTEITDAALAVLVRDSFSAADRDGLGVVVTRETFDGLPFRRVALSYRVKVAVPGVPGGAIDLRHDRRIPVL